MELGVQSIPSVDESVTLQSTAPVFFRTLPFDLEGLKKLSCLEGWEKDWTYASFHSDDKLYALLTSFIPRIVEDTERRSLECSFVPTHDDSDDESDTDEHSERNTSSTKVRAGLGYFRFSARCKSGNIREFHAVHQALGSPVGTSCGVEIYRELILLVKGVGKEGYIQDLTDELVSSSEKSKAQTFGIYRWHMRHCYWRHERDAPARPVSSVILPKSTKELLFGDVEEFLSRETKKWYGSHGIPYKRSYLFFGTPGTGKTSTISALAGRFSRSVCYLVASHPEMTDDSIKSAVESTPRNAIVVLEDIDALFQKDRTSLGKSSPLTFSGLLNALDGVGSGKGIIFILTTNFREKLDAALIRNGRVDLHVEFTFLNREQASEMFAQFYPGSSESMCASFAKALFDGTAASSAEEGADQPAPHLTAAALQSFFIRARKRTATEAIETVAKDILVDMQLRKERFESKQQCAAEGEEKDEGAKAANQNSEAGMKQDASSKGGESRAIHVHVHAN